MSIDWIIPPRQHIDDAAEFRRFVHELESGGCDPQLHFWPHAMLSRSTSGTRGTVFRLLIEASLPYWADEPPADRREYYYREGGRYCVSRRVQAGYIDRGLKRMVKLIELILSEGPVVDPPHTKQHEPREREARVINLRDET